MQIALIADTFLPGRTSGAVQLRDLSREFVAQGHDVTVMVPSTDSHRPWALEHVGGLKVLRLRSPRTKDVGYLRRTVGEFLMPYSMLRNLRRAPCADHNWDGVVWYSPSIFLGPIVSAIKRASGCRSYLILRDIFPEWAVDMGLLRKGLPYMFFKGVAQYQYSVADVIGVQSPANEALFEKWGGRPGHQLQVLQNWLAEAPNIGCSIAIDETHLAGRMIFVYAGNMGVAQGTEVLLNLAEKLKHRSDIGFLFVGRGSHVAGLKSAAFARNLQNVAFFDEIDPDEIPGLYAQCHVGLVALDVRHTTHNVPGKFLSYMQAGLPVLASLNPGNDLVTIITRNQVGRVCTDASVDSLVSHALDLTDELTRGDAMKMRCRQVASGLFSPAAAVRQIVGALQM